MRPRKSFLRVLLAALVVVGLAAVTQHPATSRISISKPLAAPAFGLVADIPGITLGRPFEVGFTVVDLESAMAQFTNGLGVTFGPVRSAVLNMRLEDGQVKAINAPSTLSVQGPPYIELVQGVSGQGENPWKATPDHSPTHTGYAVRDLAGDSDALVAAGWPRTITLDVPGQSASIFAYHRGPGGIAIELFDAQFAPPGVCDTPNSPFCAP
jgi:hypothetical protein